MSQPTFTPGDKVLDITGEFDGTGIVLVTLENTHCEIGWLCYPPEKYYVTCVNLPNRSRLYITRLPNDRLQLIEN